MRSKLKSAYAHICEVGHATKKQIANRNPLPQEEEWDWFQVSSYGVKFEDANFSKA